ncbi:hypothetical protein ACTFIY_010531 [Dictyostelium cf. discoideum]
MCTKSFRADRPLNIKTIRSGTLVLYAIHPPGHYGRDPPSQAVIVLVNNAAIGIKYASLTDYGRIAVLWDSRDFPKKQHFQKLNSTNSSIQVDHQQINNCEIN